MRRNGAKRSAVATITTLSIVALLLVSLTVAFLTDTRSTLNVLNIGNGTDGQNSVQIALLETEFGATPNADAIATENGLAGEYDYVILHDLLPGDEVNKDSTVKNVGTSEVYVRIRLTDKEGNDIDANAAPYSSLSYSLTKAWTQGADGYYYYAVDTSNACSILDRDVEVPVFVTAAGGSGSYTIKISEDVNNDTLKDLEGKIDIKVTVDAIQARNFTPAPIDSPEGPWGDEEIIATNNRIGM